MSHVPTGTPPPPCHDKEAAATSARADADAARLAYFGLKTDMFLGSSYDTVKKFLCPKPSGSLICRLFDAMDKVREQNLEDARLDHVDAERLAAEAHGEWMRCLERHK